MDLWNAGWQVAFGKLPVHINSSAGCADVWLSSGLVHIHLWSHNNWCPSIKTSEGGSGGSRVLVLLYKHMALLHESPSLCLAINPCLLSILSFEPGSWGVLSCSPTYPPRSVMRVHLHSARHQSSVFRLWLILSYRKLFIQVYLHLAKWLKFSNPDSRGRSIG